MKPLITVLFFILIIQPVCFPQQYGWTDIGSFLPSSSGNITLPDLYFVNDNEGWICSGLVGEIYHTTDGGSTYTTQTTQYSTNSIYMLNSGEGYSGGLNGRVYRTTDGGGTWSVLGSIGSTLLSISFPPSSTTGYCCGYTGKIYSITSTGVSSMSSGVTANLRSISFPSSGLGWTCADGIILHFDGSTWYEQDSPLSSYNGIYMINNTTGWAVGALGVIVNTTDGGLSWNYQANPDTSTRDLNDVFFLNASEGWAVGTSGVILHTTNGGTLWSIEGAGMTTNMLRSVRFTSLTNGYVLGNNKTLLKYTQLTGIEENKQTLEINIFPNPTRGILKLEITDRQTVESAVISDMMGREVIKKENLFVNEIDLQPLPDGFYLIRIVTNKQQYFGKIIKQ